MDLLILDTDLGENPSHQEVSDEQATTYVFRRVQTWAAALVLDQSYSHIEACR